MAKTEIRTASVTEAIAALVDQGAEVDSKLKNLALEDKGIKAKLIDEVKFEATDNSVRVAGTKSKALLSHKTAYELEPTDKIAFDKRFCKGEFGDTVKRELTINIGPAISVEQVAAMVKALGGVVEATYSVEGKNIKNEAAEKVVKTAGAVEKITTSVKYEN